MRSLTLSILLSLFILPLSAQNHSFEMGYGSSLRSLVVKGLFSLDDNAHVEGTAVLIGGYEYRVNEWFGIGLGYTHQRLQGSYEFQANIGGMELADVLSFENTRWSVAFEPKLYYPIKVDKFEFYSSARLGFKRDKVDAWSTHDDVNEIAKLTDLITGNPLNVSLTPIGINFFPIEYVGIGLAGNVLNPYTAKASLFIRF